MSTSLSPVGLNRQHDSEIYMFDYRSVLISKGDLLVRKLEVDDLSVDAYAIVVSVFPEVEIYALGFEPTLFQAYNRAQSVGHRPKAWHRVENRQLIVSGGTFGTHKAPDATFAELPMGRDFLCRVTDEIHRKVSNTQALAITGFESGETFDYDATAGIDFATVQMLVDYGVVAEKTA